VTCCSLAIKNIWRGALAELLSFRDGGVASKQQVPEKIGLELFRAFPGDNKGSRYREIRPVVKTRVASHLTRVVAGSNPATGITPV